MVCLLVVLQHKRINQVARICLTDYGLNFLGFKKCLRVLLGLACFNVQNNETQILKSRKKHPIAAYTILHAISFLLSG